MCTMTDRRNGRDMYAPKRSESTDCTYDRCAEKHYAKGYCRLHYARLKNGADISCPEKKHG